MRGDSTRRLDTDWDTWEEEEGVIRGEPIAEEGTGPFFVIHDDDGYSVWQQDQPPAVNEHYIQESTGCRILRFNRETNCFEEWVEGQTWQPYESQ